MEIATADMAGSRRGELVSFWCPLNCEPSADELAAAFPDLVCRIESEP